MTSTGGAYRYIVARQIIEGYMNDAPLCVSFGMAER